MQKSLANSFCRYKQEQLKFLPSNWITAIILPNQNHKNCPQTSGQYFWGDFQNTKCDAILQSLENRPIKTYIPISTLNPKV